MCLLTEDIWVLMFFGSIFINPRCFLLNGLFDCQENVLPSLNFEGVAHISLVHTLTKQRTST